MSTISYLASLVQQVIGRQNLIESNAKKVDELPHQTTLEPTSKIPVSRAGISEHLTVQQIISSIQNSNYNQLLAVGTIDVDGTDIIVPTGVSGQINGALYGTSSETTIPITLCDAGFSRKDILVLTTSNTVIAISGEETDGAIVLAPPTPTDAVYITEFDVNDTTIGAPIDPTLGTQFVKKTDNSSYAFSDTGTNVELAIPANGASMLFLTNAALVSVSGFSLANITGNPSAEVPYNGKPFFIVNNTGVSITLNHDETATVPFFFIAPADIVIPPSGIIELRYATDGISEVFKSWSEVDLSTKVDKVSTTGVERAYIINADGSQGTKPSSEFGISLPDLQRYSIYAWRPTPTGWYGFSTPAFVGTADNQSPLFSGNNFIKSVRHRRLSAATAGSSSEYYEQSFRQTSIGDGFYFSMKFGNEDASAVSDARVFAGLLGDLAVFGNVNPSTKGNIIGVGADSGDTNLSFIHNDSAGTAVKVSLGASFPANTIATDLYCLQMYNAPASTSIWYRVINVSTKVETAWVEITTELPAVNQILLPKCWRNNGTTALAVRLSLVDLTLYKRI